MNLKKTIAALNFDWVNSDIEPNFTLEPIRSTDFVLYHPNKYVTSQDVEQYAKDNDLEVANLAELLAYAKEGWNNQDWIVALGSSAVFLGHRYVPCLYGSGAGRGLGLHWYGFDWREYCRFLLVRKGNLDTGTLEPSELGISLENRIRKLEKFQEKEIKLKFPLINPLV